MSADNSKCLDCRKCGFGKIKSSYEDEYGGYGCYGFEFENIYCSHPQFDKEFLVDQWIDSETEVTIPSWCPLRKNERIAASMQNLPKYRKCRTSSEISAICRGIKPITEWDDIEVGEIYHVPPIGSDKRYDVFVLEKDSNMLRVKRITNLDTCTGYTDTSFKSCSYFWKFMSKHKLRDVSEALEKCREEAKKNQILFKNRTYPPSM